MVVDRFSLAIEPGSMVALLGPSGCGKTTCLRMIAGLVKPSGGEIFVNGQSITDVAVHRRNIGMLFQNYALFPHMSVAENVAFGLEARGIGAASASVRVLDALKLVQLDGFEQRLPSQLSGGQQQRVALARAIVIEPAVMLLDEPLGALDKGLRESMQVELRALQRRLGITTILVTHDQEEALTLADRIAIMRSGRLEQFGTPAEVYEHPVSRFVAGFVGVSNFFRGRIDRREGRAARVITDAGAVLLLEDCPQDRDEVTIALRPEAILIEPGTDIDDINTVEGTIEQIVYRGFVNHTYLRLRNGEILVAFETNRPDARSDPVGGPGVPVRARWAASSNRVVHD
jgi:putative spermidine/putrescine transport system ATP-binding protein/spermidine/putrescine transport system ATP-binding protein